MDTFRIMDLSAAGMVFQRTRLEVAALNLANVSATRPAGEQPFQPMTVTVAPQTLDFNSVWSTLSHGSASVAQPLVVPTHASPRMVYEPQHPHANESGMVAYPAIDHLGEMMSVMTATRVYEANLAALQATKNMASRALEIGSN